MNFNLSDCDREIADCIGELANYFDVHICKKGIRLTVFPSEIFRVSKKGDCAQIFYSERCQIFKGIAELMSHCGDFDREYTASFDTLALMEDFARNAVMQVSAIKKLIATLAMLGFNQLELYLEDELSLDSEPRFGSFRGRFSSKELREIDAYGKRFGVEVMGCIQTLAHMNQIFRWNEYAAIRDCEDILLVGEEATYRLLDKIFKEISENLTSRKINIGFDEAHLVGAGKYADINGYHPRTEILAQHLKKVCEIANKYGLKPIMWSDMFFKLLGGGYYNDNEIPERVIGCVPKNVSLCYWHYYCKDKNAYDRMIERHKCFRNEIWFAGGTSAWMNFTPMNSFTEQVVDESVKSCAEHGIKHYVFTDWGDDGGECPVFASLPVIYRVGQRAYGSFDKEGFGKIFGVSYDDFMMLDAPNLLSEGQNALVNPAKYIFYNDCLCGIFDKNIRVDEPFYRMQISRIPDVSGEYGLLFSTAKRLAEVILLKYDIGSNTRNLYRCGDKKGLKKLIEEKYILLSEAVEKFYQSFREQWFLWNKAFGWEVQDIRIGGLMARIRSCMERLKMYVDGKISILEELEEEPVADTVVCEGELLRVPKWRECVSTNNI